MTEMARAGAPFGERPHHPILMSAIVFIFWMAASLLVTIVRITTAHSAPGLATMVIAGVLLLASYAYTRTAARNAGVAHALGVGSTWLALSILVEATAGRIVGHGWFTLLGAPDRPLLRNVILFAWIFGPALFARRGTEA